MIKMKTSTSSTLHTFLSIGLLLIVFTIPALPQPTDRGTNIALSKPVAVMTSPASSQQQIGQLSLLTDGATTPVNAGQLWVQPTAIIWAKTSPVCLIVDLGSTQPISGFSYHTAAGAADVTWPTVIHMAVSDDQKTWRYAGDLIELSAREGKQPPKDGNYHEFTFATRDLKAKGRYVAFGINSELYVATDEIEVYAGDKQWLSQPDETIFLPNQPDNVLDYMRALAVKQKQTERIKADALAIQELISQSRLNREKKTDLSKKLAVAQEHHIRQPLPGPDFKAIAPINDSHREVLAVYGELLANQGFKPITIWSQHRYTWLPLLAKPDTTKKSELNFSMLRNQYRSQALLVTNAGSMAKTVRLKLNAAPRNAQPGWLQVDEAAWTDTHQGIVIADALLPTAQNNGDYVINIPAGMTRKIWITIDSSKLSSGSFKSSFTIETPGGPAAVPLNLDISNIAMERPRISLGMWDDADSAEINGGLGITMKNREAALKLMQSHYVDTAWGKRPSLPWPQAEDFDAKGNLIGELDFTAFNRWIRQWPEGRRFYNFIYADVYANGSFAGVAMGTPEFNVRVGNWAKKLAGNMVKLGLEPKQLGILIVDEPRTEGHDTIVANWTAAFKSAAPEISIFTNPVWVRPDLVKNQGSITSADVISPALPEYYHGGVHAKKYYENLRRQGKELWLYQCTGPVRLFDPQRYYRYQAWHVYSINGTGQGFWSFGDTGTSNTSWNDYINSTYLSFTPAFIDVETVNNSIHWDAVREGMTDFEELAMLRDAIQAGTNAPLRAQAQKIHDDAVKAVTGIWNAGQPNAERFSVNTHYDWRSDEYNAELADQQLEKVRAMLSRLRQQR